MGVIRSLLFGTILLAFLLVVIVANVGTWGLRTVLDEKAFVSTADAALLDPRVQTFLAERVSNRIAAFVVQKEADLPKVALQRLGIKANATQDDVQAAIQPVVEQVLADPRAQAVVSDSLRTLHAQVAAIAAGSGAISVQGDTLVLDLDQLVDEVDQRLDPSTSGFFGVAIPAGLGSIPLVQSNALKSVSTVLNLARIAQWFLVGALIVVGVLAIVFARRRAEAVIWLGAFLMIGGLVCLGLVLLAGAWLPAAAQTPAGEAALQGVITGFLGGLTVQSAVVAAAGIGVMIIGLVGSRMQRKPEPGISFAQ